jgi:hypothetical protein
MAYTGGSGGLTVLIGTVSNNIFYGGSGSTLGGSLITADPTFVSVSGNDFHLAAGSPAIGAGAMGVSSIVTTDYDVKARSATAIDIGALGH